MSLLVAPRRPGCFGGQVERVRDGSFRARCLKGCLEGGAGFEGCWAESKKALRIAEQKTRMVRQGLEAQLRRGRGAEILSESASQRASQGAGASPPS